MCHLFQLELRNKQSYPVLNVPPILLRFRNRQSQSRLLGGTRSISEDSVFSPERETTNLQTLKQRAVSEESVPRTALQVSIAFHFHSHV